MASLAENRPLLYALVVGFTTLAAAALEVGWRVAIARKYFVQGASHACNGDSFQRSRVRLRERWRGRERGELEGRGRCV